MDGKRGLVVGIANDHSYAYSIAESLIRVGADCAFTHLPGERMERRCRKAVAQLGQDDPWLESMDAGSDDDLDRVSTERNTDRFQIHTVGLGMNRISNQDGTLRLIAEENGGVYVRFETAGDVPDTGEVIPR